MAKAQIKKEHYETFISSGHKKMIADEPLDKGGTDLGMSPLELLESSLAACVAITVRMYADRKQWPLEQINVDVSLQQDQSFEKKVEFIGDLTDDQIERLKDIADKCPVNKILSKANTINTSITWKKL